MKKLLLVALDILTCGPITGVSFSAAWATPFAAEVLFWVSIMLSAAVVALPTALLLAKKEIERSTGVLLTSLYVVMLLVAVWLLMSSINGSWWEITILALSIVGIAKGIYVTKQIEKVPPRVRA